MKIAIYDFYGPGSLTALSVARLKISGKYATWPAADRLGPFISPRIPPLILAKSSSPDSSRLLLAEVCVADAG